MKRLAILLFAPIALATPVLADEPTSPPVVVLRGSSAPPTPWYEPPPPQVQTVYVPVFSYPVWANGRFVARHHHASSPARSR